MITTSDDLVDLTVAALRAANVVGGNVWSYRDWPTTPRDDPIVILDLPDEEKTSLGRSGWPQFLVLATVPITIKASRLAKPDDFGALELQQDLALIKRQVEVAVINAPDLTARLQHMPFVRTVSKIEARDRHHGQVQLQLGMEFYQGPEAFHQPETTDLEGASITIGPYPPHRVDAVLDV
jgi:hypothetical protein